MRSICLLLTLVLGVLTVGACMRMPDRPNRVHVLFVGNSLTYFGNLPAVFDALSRANDHTSHSDMIVSAGATLAERVDDGSVLHALTQGAYTHVVLQERGGDFMCSFGPESCPRAVAALISLASAAREHGAVPLLLGSYQINPSASIRIVEAESNAARTAAVPYIALSEYFQIAQKVEPDMPWLHADGNHPGSVLTLLQALLLYRAIYDDDATSSDFTVTAPIYGHSSGLEAVLRAADAPPPVQGTPQNRAYTVDEVTFLLHLIETHTP